MIFHDIYTNVPDAEIERFVGAQELGRLVTVAADGTPHIGLYPFAYDGAAFEIHLVRTDEQIADLNARARCLFEVDEVLATIPSYWVDPENAIMATAYHRTVMFECHAIISGDAAELAAQQMRLLARYQPEGGFRPVTPDDPMYRGAIQHITAVRLDVRARRAKFKLAQNRPPEIRAGIADQLRKRGRGNDERAAEALLWTIEQEAKR
jgi:predicted FMN-binding regulatory protein PaiB